MIHLGKRIERKIKNRQPVLVSVPKAAKGRTMSKESDSHRLLTVSELAKTLRVTPGTVYRMAWAGAIPGAFQIRSSWRFPIEQIERWTKTVEYRAALGMKKTEPDGQ
jgi:excisionase family DNA binding protein